jgi:hypothetical protein
MLTRSMAIEHPCLIPADCSKPWQTGAQCMAAKESSLGPFGWGQGRFFKRPGIWRESLSRAVRSKEYSVQGRKTVCNLDRTFWGDHKALRLRVGDELKIPLGTGHRILRSARASKGLETGKAVFSFLGGALVLRRTAGMAGSLCHTPRTVAGGDSLVAMSGTPARPLRPQRRCDDLKTQGGDQEQSCRCGVLTHG